MLNVIPYEVAVSRTLNQFAEIIKSEKIAIGEAIGRICLTDVVSAENIPAFNRSNVDGYAVNCKDANAASSSSPAVFVLDGAVKMGEVIESEITVGHCFYVPTGGMLPKGANAVAMIEDAEVRGEEILLSKPLRVFENVTASGEDVQDGEVILKRGTIITDGKSGALYAAGVTEVVAVKKPRFYLISTGDELIPHDSKCPYGKIKDVNSGLIKSAARYWEHVGGEIISDDYRALTMALERGMERADIVIMSGGSSVGIADYTEQIFSEHGELFLHGVAVKPGKPTLAACGEKMLIGLPGHPMAAYISFKMIFERAFLKAAGCLEKNTVFAVADVNFAGGGGRTSIMPVALNEDGRQFRATPLYYKSGMVGVLAQCDGFAVIPDYEEGVNKGDILKIYTI